MSKSLLNVSNKEGTDEAGGLNCIYRQRGLCRRKDLISLFIISMNSLKNNRGLKYPFSLRVYENHIVHV